MQMDKEYLEKINVENDSPGPAAYFVKPTIGQGATDPTIEKNPAYSIRGRLVKNVSIITPVLRHPFTAGKTRDNSMKIYEAA